MQRQTKRYQFILRTVAPVHIGSGETYTPKNISMRRDSIISQYMGKLYQRDRKSR